MKMTDRKRLSLITAACSLPLFEACFCTAIETNAQKSEAGQSDELVCLVLANFYTHLPMCHCHVTFTSMPTTSFLWMLQNENAMIGVKNTLAKGQAYKKRNILAPISSLPQKESYGSTDTATLAPAALNLTLQLRKSDMPSCSKLKPGRAQPRPCCLPPGKVTLWAIIIIDNDSIMTVFWIKWLIRVPRSEVAW